MTHRTPRNPKPSDWLVCTDPECGWEGDKDDAREHCLCDREEPWGETGHMAGPWCRGPFVSLCPVCLEPAKPHPDAGAGYDETENGED